MTPISLNHKFRKLASLQGPIDTSKWQLHINASQTGDEHAYGENEDYQVTQEYVNYAVQCYASRPVHYKDAPVRESGYHDGGRPKGWTPAMDGNDPSDMENGDWKSPEGNYISGLDLVHFPLAPLVSIVRSKGFTVNTEKGPMPAETIAHGLLCSLSDAHVGMVRELDGDPSSYLGSDRQQHYILRTTVDGLKYGFLSDGDANGMKNYILDTVLPRWEKIPYMSLTRVYNGLFWVLPALWDAYVIAPPGNAAVLAKHLLAKAECCLQLAKALPGKSCTVMDVTQWGPDMQIVQAKDHYGPWGIRAMLVAAKIIGNTDGGHLCFNEAMSEFEKWKGKPQGGSKVEWKSWCVDTAGNYLWS